MFKPFYYSLLLQLLFLQYSQAQLNSVPSEYYLAFDSIIGVENSGLYNGKRYIERYRSSEDNHHFFKDYNFVDGSVVYNNQPFFNLKIKYDLYEDVLVANLKGDKKFFNMVFINQQVHEFNIHGHYFVNINAYSSSDNFSGFAELLYTQNDVSLLKKHLKEKKDKIKGQTVFHEFKARSIYLVLINGSLTTIKSKKDFKNIYPEKYSEINSFYKENKFLQEKNSDSFMIRLIDEINKI
ncbi:hypothetical protein [Hanstruepera ponticola]|uniref:hypothetical protein n=1 Tax=Hanstruepera ponticola TaxID=2042995 RepID=UPI0017836902|nr:hypothetical protein [Hanstruepera ponticola]